MKKQYLPLYIRIKSDIVNRILSGELKKDDRLPTERELSETFNVSRVTVVGALRELAAEGVIRKRRGSGSYVNRDAIEDDYGDIFSLVTAPAETSISFGIFSPSPEYHMLMSALAGVFQLENPDVKVSVATVSPPSDPNGDAYLTLIGGGSAPAAGEFYFHAEYAAIGALEPLEDLPGFGTLFPSLLPHCARATPNAAGEEHVHSVATRINARVVLVNPDMLDDAGIDVSRAAAPSAEELLEWSVKLGDFTRRESRGRHGVYLETPEGWHGVNGHLPYLWGSAAGLENSPAGFMEMLGRPECAAGLNFLSEINSRGNPAPACGADLFAAGMTGMILSSTAWPLLLSGMMSRKIPVKAFLIPSLSGGPGTSVTGDFRVGIFSSAARSRADRDAAWRWIKFLLRKKTQWLLGADMSFPSIRNVPARIEKTAPEAARVFQEAVKNSAPQFDFKKQRAVMSVFGAQLRQRLAGAVTSEQCVRNSLSTIRDILA
jgi:DNA-binding transcriptional regulator YhcF (GntR family)